MEHLLIFGNFQPHQIQVHGLQSAVPIALLIILHQLYPKLHGIEEVITDVQKQPLYIPQMLYKRQY